MREITILLLTLLFLWSCDNTASNNDPIEDVKPDPISSVDTTEEVSSLPVKIQEKRIMGAVDSYEKLTRYVVPWSVSLNEYFSREDLMEVYISGKYKVILRINSNGVKDTTKVPPLLERVKKNLESCMPYAKNFPENIIHEWYEDSSTTEPMTYLWFEPNIEAAKIAIHEKK